jgi:CRP-like cAMP-binding protein
MNRPRTSASDRSDAAAPSTSTGNAPFDEASIGLLRGLDRDAAAELLAAAERRVVRADQELYKVGAPARAVHLLTAGAARLGQTTPSGARVIVKYVAPGEVFGIPALLTSSYPTTAMALSDGVELQWPAEVIRALLSRHPALAFNVIRDLEARLRELEGRLGDLSSEPVEQRLARTVLRLVDRFGVRHPDGIEIPFPVTRQDLADLVGTTLHTVSRTLHTWEAQRQIGRRRSRLVIADVEAVARVLHKGTESPARLRQSRRPSGKR